MGSVKKYNLKFFLLGLLIWGVVNKNAFATVQATYYISPDGHDYNPGTITQPFATLQKARDIVQGINKNMSGDIIIYLRGGVYELGSTFTLSSQDSGSNGYQIIYQAYPCETPVISGGMKITDWVLHDPIRNIHKTFVNPAMDTRQLYVNGVRAIRARSKDASGWTESGDGYHCPNSVSSWKNIQHVEVVSYHAWKCHRGPIDFMSGETHVVMAQPYWKNLHEQDNAPPAWVENAYELLDEAGEWYFDRSAGLLYYKPLDGEDMSVADVIMPRLGTLINGSRVSNVQFKGLTFKHTTWTLPNTPSGFSCLQGDAMISGPNKYITQLSGSIVFDHSAQIKFENNIFQHLGETALQFYIGCKNNSIYNNVFKDISGSAISIGGLTNPNPSFTDFVKDNIVDNNSIKNVALEFKGCVGVFVGYTEHTTITHNEISCLPYTAISAGWGWRTNIIAGKNNEISFNRIDSLMMELIDGGGIYTLSSQPGAQVFGNYISNQFNNYGALYPDEGSSNMHWHHNVLRNVPQWLFMWTPSNKNNIVDFNYFDKQEQTIKGSHCTVQNNTFVPNRDWPNEASKIINTARRVAIKNKLTGQSVSFHSSILQVKDLLPLEVNQGSCMSIPTNYSWSSDDTAIAKISSTGLISAESIGATTIRVTALDGTLTDSLEITVIASFPHIDSSKNAVYIYPNPANEKLYIMNLKSNNAMVTIFNMQGKILFDEQIYFDQINLSNLLKGFYIIKIIDSGKETISKLVRD